MFGIFGIFGAIFSAITAVVRTVISIVKDIVMWVVRRTLHTLTHIFGNDRGLPLYMDWVLFKHFDWRRAILGQKELDDAVERLTEDLGDADRNGIPDLYDQEVTDPSQDFLGIKYPQRLLRENDYVRFMPRAIGGSLLPQPVAMGGKGLVRSETVNNMGAYVWVKWNALNPRGAAQAPLWRVNQMDLFFLGHVHDSYRVTQ